MSYDGRDYYTMHNVEVRVFNHDLMFVNSYDPVTNPKGDEALPADRANRNITPFTWLFAQTQEVIPAPESITLSETELELKVGETAQITATVLPENADSSDCGRTLESGVQGQDHCGGKRNRNGR